MKNYVGALRRWGLVSERLANPWPIPGAPREASFLHIALAPVCSLYTRPMAILYTLQQRALFLLSAIGKMVEAKRYQLPMVFAALCAQLSAIAPVLARSPTNLSPDLVRGHAMVGQADLPYNLLSKAEGASGCPDLEETLLTSGYCNIGFFGKHLVVKNKYIVSAFYNS